MSRIRGIIISLVVFVFNIIGVKADPGNYVIEFGVGKDEKCSDCRQDLCETKFMIAESEYRDNTLLLRFNYEIHIYPENGEARILPPLGILNCFGGDSYWDMREHAFIDLDEYPVKYRCIECMVKHANEQGHLESLENYNIKPCNEFYEANLIETLSEFCSVVDSNKKIIPKNQALLKAISEGKGRSEKAKKNKCLVCVSRNCCIVKDGKSECMICKKTEGEKFVCHRCLRVVAHTDCLKDGTFNCYLCKDGETHIKFRKFVIVV